MKAIKKRRAVRMDRKRSSVLSIGSLGRSPGIALAAIALIGLLAYSNTFHAPFLFDDNAFILNDPAVKDLKYFSDSTLIDKGIENDKLDINFRTRIVPFFSFALNYQFGGLKVAGYHAVNLLIHLANAWLLYWLVLQTFRTPFFRRQVSEILPPYGTSLAAGLAALMFVSHPLQIQAVTYVSQRFASMATLFYLLSLTHYVRARLAMDEPEQTAAGKSARSFLSPHVSIPYAISLLSALLAMHSKEIAFTLPLMIMLYEFMFFEGRKQKRFLFVLPLLLTMLVIPLSIIGNRTVHGELDNLTDSIQGSGSGSHALTYLYTQFRVIMTYLRLFLLPVGQNIDYDYPRAAGFLQTDVVLSFLFLLLLFSTAIVLYCRSERPEGPDGPLLRLTAFGIFWFFLALSVESSILPLTDIIFEHRMYLPSIGLCLAVLGSLCMAWNRAASERRKTILALVALVIGIWSVMTYMRNEVWTDKVAIWRDAVLKSPHKSNPHNNLGWAYLELGRNKEAIQEFEASIRFDPQYVNAYRNLGIAYMDEGDHSAAMKAFQQAIALKDNNAGVHGNLAVVYRRMGRFADAEKEHLRAIAMDKDVASVLSELGFKSGE